MTVYEAEVSYVALRRSNWRASAAVALACGFALIPILLCTLPPVMDLPNHLARIWLLSGGVKTPPLSAIYEPRWAQASTNVAIDFAGALAMRAFGFVATTKILLALMFIGPPLGAALFNRAIFGRFHIWQLLGVMLAWCTTAVEGFLSFQIGLGLALCCAAAALPLSDKLTPMRMAAIGLTAAALLLIHPFALLFFTACVVGLVLGEELPQMRTLWGERGLRFVGYGMAGVVPLILLFVLSPHPPGAHGVGTHLMHWEPFTETLMPKHLAMLYLSPFLSYRALWDVAMLAPIAGVIVWLAATHRIRVHAGLLSIAALMLAIAPFLPTNIGDGGALPIRFCIMGLLLASAATRPVLASTRATALVAVTLVVVAIARIGTMTWVWHTREVDSEQLQQATQDIPPGASVLVLQQKWRDLSTVPLGRLVAGCPGYVCASERHFGSMVVVWRHAFVPTLFTVPGQHALGVRMPWRAKAVIASGIPFADEISWETKRDPYLIDWQDKFDYVLLLNADLGHTPLPDTQVLKDTGFARVYRVEHAHNFARLYN